MSGIRIYGHAGSGNAFKPNLLASLLGIKVDFIQIALGQTSTQPDCENASPAFRALNPAGAVPVLVDSREEISAAGLDVASAAAFSNSDTLAKYGPPGRIVRDSGACLVYLALSAAAANPALASWYPVADATAAARVQQWLTFASTDINTSLLHVRIALIFSWAIPGTVDEALERSRRTLAALEARLIEGTAAGELWFASKQGRAQPHCLPASVRMDPARASLARIRRAGWDLPRLSKIVRALPRFIAQDGIFFG